MALLQVYKAWLEHDRSAKWCREYYVHARALRLAQEVRAQIERTVNDNLSSVKKLKIELPSEAEQRHPDPILLCRVAIAKCLFPHTARRLTDHARSGYQLYNDDPTWVYIHPSSVLSDIQPKWIVFHELVYTTKPYVRNVCAVEYKWVQPLLPLLSQADIHRLTGRHLMDMNTINNSNNATEAQSESFISATASKSKSTATTDSNADAKRKQAIEEAKKRYLERKGKK